MNKINKILICMVILLSMVGTTNAIPVEEWNRTYNIDNVESSQQTADGGYVIIGDSSILKTDTKGNLQWSKNYNGSIHSGQQIASGGYILGGTGINQPYIAPFQIIKLDINGNTLWTKYYFGGDINSGMFIQQTTDGGYILMGCIFDYEPWFQYMTLIKTDSNGNILWNESPFEGCAFFGQQTKDGGYVIGSSFYDGDNDILLIKTDSDGNKLWNKTFGGTNNDEGYFVRQTKEGGYIIVGYTRSYGAGGSDAYIVKTDNNGNRLWSKTFGGSNDDGLSSVQQTMDGGYIFAGYTRSYSAGGSDAWIIRTDNNGNRLWSKTFGGLGDDYANSAYQTKETGYILAGIKNTKAWLIKLSAENLLKNPGFETSYGLVPMYWSKYQTGTKAIFTYPETGRIGGKSVTIKYLTKETGKGGLWRQQGIVVSPSKQYKLSGYMKLNNVTGGGSLPRYNGAGIRITWYKSDGNVIKTDVINKIGTIAWAKYEKIFTAPSNAVKATIGGDLFNSSGKVWFDDMSFVRIS